MSLKEYIKTNFIDSIGRLKRIAKNREKWDEKRYNELKKNFDIFNTDDIYQMMYNCLNDIKTPLICEVCGNDIQKYRDMKKGYTKYCSNICTSKSPNNQEKSRKTKLEKYGDENYCNVEKREATKLERYGDKNYRDINKTRKTKLEKYGDEDFNNRKKMKETKLNNHGDENYNNREKYKQTNLDRYGVENYVNPDQIKETKLNKFKDIDYKDDFIKRVKETKLNNHGDENYCNANKIKETKLERYGDPDFNNPEKNKETSLKRYGKISHTQKHLSDEAIKLSNDKEYLIDLHHNQEIPLQHIAELLGFHQSHMSKIFDRFDIEVRHYNSSYKEELLFNEIEKRYNGEIKRNVRKILGGKEIDIYIPELKIGFEFNGRFYHKENKIGLINKTVLTKEKGIILYHINEHQWDDIIKRNIILNKLDYIFNKAKTIYARKCDIKEININERETFLNKYHLKGDGVGSINYGLVYNNELVAVMCFKQQKDNILYLNRFASKNVVGGFSKLLSYISKTYKPSSIETFVDICWSGLNETVYEKNGFERIGITPPNYFYFKNKVHLSRQQCMKHKLHKILGDNFDPNLTEHENMYINGFYRFYDAGNIKLVKKDYN